MRQKYLLIGLVLLILLTLVGGTFYANRETPSSEKLKVVATTSQLGDFVKNIGGEKIDLEVVFEPNVDPHDYSATPQDVEALTNADLVIQNGLGLEEGLAEIINNQVDPNKIFTASESVNTIQDDPHIWFSVGNAKLIVIALEKRLSELDPENTAAYKENSNSYLDQLDNLDKYIQNEVGKVPLQSRKIVTDHDVFGYFARDYNFEIIATVIPSLSTNSEPSAKQMASLVDQINEAKVKAIFTSFSSNNKITNQIGNDTGATVEVLYGDSLGEKGSEGETYLQMMKYNTDTIVRSLII